MDLSGLTAFEPIAVQEIAELIKKAAFNEANLSQEVSIVSDIKYRKKPVSKHLKILDMNHQRSNLSP